VRRLAGNATKRSVIPDVREAPREREQRRDAGAVVVRARTTFDRIVVGTDDDDRTAASRPGSPPRRCPRRRGHRETPDAQTRVDEAFRRTRRLARAPRPPDAPFPDAAAISRTSLPSSAASASISGSTGGSGPRGSVRHPDHDDPRGSRCPRTAALRARTSDAYDSGTGSTYRILGRPYEGLLPDQEDSFRRRPRTDREPAGARGEVSTAARLPYSLKILLENLLRHEDGETVTRADIEALAKWNARAEPSREIQFTPARVLLQDFTGVPAVVDLAAMRDAMKRMGGDPKKINPLQPVELVIDHSVQVDVFGYVGAFAQNAALEFERNKSLRLPSLRPRSTVPRRRRTPASSTR
jgi:hypothetical protein